MYKKVNIIFIISLIVQEFPVPSLVIGFAEAVILEFTDINNPTNKELANSDWFRTPYPDKEFSDADISAYLKQK